MTWLMIRNPASGNRRRSRKALELARDRGFDIVESEQPGETVDIASEAATQGRERIAACGGDGTINQVVRGVELTGRLSETTIGVVPTGTGNGFARDIGITDVRQALDILEHGRERWLDIGMADSRPFLKSCISGFPADVSARTTPELKQLTGRFAYGLGILPYILEALRTNQIPLPEISVHVGTTDDPVWDGTAVLLLAGNSRQFPGIVSRRTDIEDGLLDIVVVKRTRAIREFRKPQSNQVGRGSHLGRYRVAKLAVTGESRIPFSLDGEFIERRRLTITIRRKALRIRVGSDYSAHPDVDTGNTARNPDRGTSSDPW